MWKYLKLTTVLCCMLHSIKKSAAFSQDLVNREAEVTDVWQSRQHDFQAPWGNQDYDIGCKRPDIYYCEEPANLVSAEAAKTCDYRNVRYHEQVFRWVAGRGCLVFTPDFLYVGGNNTLNLNANCFYMDLVAPCLEIAKSDGSCGCYPFDPGLEEVSRAVEAALLPAAHGRWERCFYAAADCCSHFINNDTVSPGHCGVTFDGWTCWPEAPAGTTATEICSDFAYSNVPPSCNHYSSKQCYEDGTWERQSEYSSCSIAPRFLRRYRFHAGALAAAAAASLPALLVFVSYRRLRAAPRVKLHVNLLAAILVRSVLVIVNRHVVFIDELTSTGDTRMSANGWGCRLLGLAERAAANAVFAAMLAEAVFLHRLLAAVFRRQVDVRWLYLMCAAVTLVPAAVWTALMVTLSDHSCWAVYSAPALQWSLDAPRLAVLLLNFGLLLDVLRVLLTKLRNSENTKQLGAARATLYLAPLFGSQFLVTILRPATSHCGWEDAYYFIAYSLEALQPVIVAALYCYTNKEVHGLVWGTLKRLESTWSRAGGASASASASAGRRLTASTALPDKGPAPARLHVAQIVSLQHSERLADILEPVYETIRNGTNDSYDSLERSSGDVGSARDFTNASSVSVDCPEWLQSATPSASLHYNSDGDKTLEADGSPDMAPFGDNSDGLDIDLDQLTIRGSRNMLDEILQYIEKNGSLKIALNSDSLCPNREDDDKVIFVEN